MGLWEAEESKIKIKEPAEKVKGESKHCQPLKKGGQRNTIFRSAGTAMFFFQLCRPLAGLFFEMAQNMPSVGEEVPVVLLRR